MLTWQSYLYCKLKLHRVSSDSLHALFFLSIQAQKVSWLSLVSWWISLSQFAHHNRHLSYQNCLKIVWKLWQKPELSMLSVHLYARHDKYLSFQSNLYIGASHSLPGGSQHTFCPPPRQNQPTFPAKNEHVPHLQGMTCLQHTLSHKLFFASGLMKWHELFQTCHLLPSSIYLATTPMPQPFDAHTLSAAVHTVYTHLTTLPHNIKASHVSLAISWGYRHSWWPRCETTAHPHGILSSVFQICTEKCEQVHRFPWLFGRQWKCASTRNSIHLHKTLRENTRIPVTLHKRASHLFRYIWTKYCESVYTPLIICASTSKSHISRHLNKSFEQTHASPWLCARNRRQMSTIPFHQSAQDFTSHYTHFLKSCESFQHNFRK